MNVETKRRKIINKLKVQKLFNFWFFYFSIHFSWKMTFTANCQLRIPKINNFRIFRANYEKFLLNCEKHWQPTIFNGLKKIQIQFRKFICVDFRRQFHLKITKARRKAPADSPNFTILTFPERTASAEPFCGSREHRKWSGSVEGVEMLAKAQE